MSREYCVRNCPYHIIERPLCQDTLMYLARVRVNARLALVIGNGPEGVDVAPVVTVEPAESGEGDCLVVVIAKEVAHDRQVHSFHARQTLSLVEPGSGEPLRFLLAGLGQVVIDEPAIIVRVNAKWGEGRTVTQLSEGELPHHESCIGLGNRLDSGTSAVPLRQHCVWT
jgi:hypothetical protein